MAFVMAIVDQDQGAFCTKSPLAEALWVIAPVDVEKTNGWCVVTTVHSRTPDVLVSRSESGEPTGARRASRAYRKCMSSERTASSRAQREQPNRGNQLSPTETAGSLCALLTGENSRDLSFMPQASFDDKGRRKLTR